MPLNVFGNSSNNSVNKFDSSLFVQKTYLRSNYRESNIEEDIDLKNQFRIKNLPDPISIKEPASKTYVDNLFNDHSIIKNNFHIDLIDRKNTNARFIQVNQLPQINSHLTANLYVDTEIDQTSVVRNNKDNDFGNYKLTNINTITLNKQPENDNEVVIKSYVDQFHQENERTRRNFGLDFYNESIDIVKNNQDNNFNNNNLTNINSITINANPINNNNVTNKKYVDDQIDNDTIVRLNDDSNDRYLKVNINNTIYNLQIYNKIILTDTTIIKFPNNGNSLLPNWRLFCNDRNNNGNINNFIRSTKTNSPTGNSGASIQPPIGESFTYIETSSNNFGSNVYCSWERIDIIQVSNITFYYNRFSIQGDFRAMGRFQIQILTKDNVWLTKFIIVKNEQFSSVSTDWIIFNLNITDENYGVKFVYDQFDSAHADMSFSDIIISHSPY